jgi:hypothetical protein
MEPVFTLPYSEYSVAQKLATVLPASHGYSLFAPLSRQQKGVDLIVVFRRGGVSRAASIQVKASRTYSDRARSARSQRFQYYTWFNNFELPSEADFIALVAIYPTDDARRSRAQASWWAPVVLLFTHAEMRRFLRSVKTRGGARDPMFGFGFDDEKAIFETRGDRRGRRLDFSPHLLDVKVDSLRDFLAGRRAARISADAG